MCKAPLPRNKRKRQQLAPLNHGEIVVVFDDPNVAGPSNIPVAEELSEADEGPDVHGVLHAFAQLNDAINMLSQKAVLDDEDVLITGEDFVNVPGEGSREDPLSDAELVALIVTGDAPDATDPDEAEEPLAVGPRMDAKQVEKVMADLTEYMQWQDWVTADDLSMLASIVDRHKCANKTTITQVSLGFLVVPKPF